MPTNLPDDATLRPFDIDAILKRYEGYKKHALCTVSAHFLQEVYKEVLRLRERLRELEKSQMTFEEQDVIRRWE